MFNGQCFRCVDLYFKVIVIVDVDTPSATTGPEPVIVERSGCSAPGKKVTVPPDIAIGVLIARVFVSAVDDFNVHVDFPDESEEEQAP